MCAGRVVNVGTLGSRPRVEEAVRLVQEKCLAEMFRVSMDRKTYAPWQVRAQPLSHPEPAGGGEGEGCVSAINNRLGPQSVVAFFTTRPCLFTLVKPTVQSSAWPVGSLVQSL